MGLHHDWVEHHHHHWSPPRIIAAAIGGTVVAVVLGFLFGWVIEHLWNALMPSLFGLKVITYWQGVGLFILAKLLFGCTPAGGARHRKRRDGRFGPWRNDDDSCGGDWKVRGGHRDWRYYDRYWKEEGRAAFEAYLDRMEKKNEGKDD
jgi:hypothetical protein